MPSPYDSFKQYLKEKYEGPFMATDIIIRYQNGIVLIERKFAPLGLALPGGIAERMQFHQNAIKEAKEETGLDIVIDNIYHPLCILSHPLQDPRAFIASVTYTAQGYGTLKPMEEEDAKSATVYTLDQIAKMLSQEQLWAFPLHHRQALKLYLEEVGYVRK